MNKSPEAIALTAVRELATIGINQISTRGKHDTLVQIADVAKRALEAAND